MKTWTSSRYSSNTITEAQPKWRAIVSRNLYPFGHRVLIYDHYVCIAIWEMVLHIKPLKKNTLTAPIELRHFYRFMATFGNVDS